MLAVLLRASPAANFPGIARLFSSDFRFPTGTGEPLRVLIISQYFWPESFRINDLALGLRERGHQVTILTGLPNYPEGRIYPGYSWSSSADDFHGLQVIRVPLVPRGRSKGLQLAVNYASFAALASLLGPRRCRQAYDAVFVFEPSPVTVGLPAVVMKRLRKVPVLFWVQDLWPETLSATGMVRSRWLLRQVDRLVRYIYRHCDRVLVQSKAFVPRIVEQGVSAERIVYLPNWAEDFFHPLVLPDDAPERAELPAGFRILFAGNIGASQGCSAILEAAHRTRDHEQLHWCLLGDGHERGAVEREVARRGLSRTVHLLPRRPVETMPRWFAAADALLVSLRRDPVFSLTIPSKLQSYLACGRPILAALDGEGAAVVRESGAGLVSPAEDARELAQNALRMLASSDFERAHMGRAGRLYFERNFQRGLLLDRLEAVLGEVAGGLRCAA
jgi:glycosyltransferase involved in cell wall biosynthesis